MAALVGWDYSISSDDGGDDCDDTVYYCGIWTAVFIAQKFVLKKAGLKIWAAYVVRLEPKTFYTD
jgi:hypothetical protein